MSVIKFKIGVDMVEVLKDAITTAIYEISLDAVGEREASYAIEDVGVEYDELTEVFLVSIRTEQEERRATVAEQREVIIDGLDKFDVEVLFTGEPGEPGWWIEPS